jgi:preprotein translocase subunit SecG
MLSGLIILHVVICILLTVTVLVQFGKGAEAGAMMGGGSSQAVFTSSSKGNFFTKMTTFLAIAFMVNSVVLTSLTSKSSKESIFDDEAPVAAPLNNDAANAGSVIPTDAPSKETAPVTSEDKK